MNPYLHAHKILGFSLLVIHSVNFFVSVCFLAWQISKSVSTFSSSVNLYNALFMFSFCSYLFKAIWTYFKSSDNRNKKSSADRNSWCNWMKRQREIRFVGYPKLLLCLKQKHIILIFKNIYTSGGQLTHMDLGIYINQNHI